MNVSVLGEDYASTDTMLGIDIDWGALANTALDTAVKVTGAVIQQRATPTQKAMLQTVTGTSTSVPANPPPQPDFLKANLPYILIGGAVLVGLVVMMKTRRGSSAPAAII